MAKSVFLEIMCPRCKYHSIVYGRSSIRKKCNRCSYLLLKTLGGKVKVKAQVIRVLT